MIKKERSMKRKAVLSDHKRAGKRLIPPILQLPNVISTSFIDDRLPDLIWMSAIFRQAHPKAAVDLIIDFIKVCSNAAGAEEFESLAFLTNFNALSAEQKANIRKKLEGTLMFGVIRRTLAHQSAILERYPLAFLFDESPALGGHIEAVAELKEDVESLLDRYSPRATKVQVTALVAMMVTGKIVISSEIDALNFDLIFTDPESDGAHRIASFARATLNSGMGFMIEDHSQVLTEHVKWREDFWAQAYLLDGCN